MVMKASIDATCEASTDRRSRPHLQQVVTTWQVSMSFETVMAVAGNEEISVEPRHMELLALIDAYIESAVDCKLLMVGKKMYATGAVQVAYASSVSNETLWTMSNAAFDAGLRCRMLDVNWWLSAARRGLLSINLMPVSLPDVSELGARTIALDMLYAALKKCAKDVTVMFFGGLPPRENAEIRRMVSRHCSNATVCTCSQPTVEVHKSSSAWRMPIEMAVPLSRMFTVFLNTIPPTWKPQNDNPSVGNPEILSTIHLKLDFGPLKHQN